MHEKFNDFWQKEKYKMIFSKIKNKFTLLQKK